MKSNNLLQAAVVVCFMFVSLAPDCMCLDEDDQRLLVKMTLVQNASAVGAYCLDGSLPGYHLHRGFGAGTRNWLLQFEVWRLFRGDKGNV